MVSKKWLAGTIKRDGRTFTPYSSELKAYKDISRKGSRRARLTVQQKITRLKQLQSAGDKLCKTGPPATPVPTPSPAHPLQALTRPMTPADINHLYKRAALGYVSPEMMAIGLTQGADSIVTSLFSKVEDSAADAEAKSWLNERNQSLATTIPGVKKYALAKLVATRNPLHNHLCMIHLHDIISVSITSVSDSSDYRNLMVRYFNTLCGVTDYGSYRTLMKEMTIDPAMLRWLTGSVNNKLKPNEDFAREFMELFTIGVYNRAGELNYSDLDVANAARAFTGMGIINSAQFGLTSIFNFSAFDAATKLMFPGTVAEGEVTDWESMVEHTFNKHPNAAHNIALMLSQRYLRPDIDQVNPALVDALAADLKSTDFDIMSMLRKLLVSAAFYDDANRQSLLRTPAEIAIHVGRAFRATGMPVEGGSMTITALYNMSSMGGMELGAPPTVFGWDRDKEFTSGTRLLGMTNQFTTILSNGSFNNEINPIGWNYKMLYPQGVASPSAEQVVDHVAAIMSVDLNETQRNLLMKYMNTQLVASVVQGSTVYKENANKWDPASYAQARQKLAGLLRIIFGSRQFRVI